MSYDPSFKTKVVGGLQWMVTSYYLITIGLGLLLFYFETVRLEYSVEISGAPLYLIVLSGSFIAGYTWVRLRTPSTEQEHQQHLQRIEYLLILVVLGLLYPLVVYGLFAVVSTSIFALPFGLIPLAMQGPPLAIALVVIYLLDVHPLIDVNTA